MIQNQIQIQKVPVVSKNSQLINALTYWEKKINENKETVLKTSLQYLSPFFKRLWQYYSEIIFSSNSS